MTVSYQIKAIWIATDADKTVQQIIDHEMGHVDDDLATLKNLRPEAEAMEKRVYPNRNACEQECIKFTMKFVNNSSWDALFHDWGEFFWY
jgi:hypothetical protein